MTSIITLRENERRAIDRPDMGQVVDLLIDSIADDYQAWRDEGDVTFALSEEAADRIIQACPPQVLLPGQLARALHQLA